MVFAIIGIFKSDSPLLINALRVATLAYIILGFCPRPPGAVKRP